jgi:D-cysteine desulfhydrase
MTRMTAPPRLQLALLPTPILKLERLSQRLGVELYVKRDDLTGLLEAGTAIRKLEFLAAEALVQGADTLVTGGPAESACCRAVAAVAARLGWRCVLAVEGERPASYDGDRLLERLLGAEIRYAPLAPDGCQVALADIAREVEREGGRPYVIPDGGANEVGALGALECGVELSEQINHGAPRFDTVVVPARHGVSQAGLLMGKQFAGLPSEVLGVSVAYPAEHVRGRIASMIDGAIRRFGFAIDVPKSIHLLDGSGPSSAPAPEDLEVMVDLARAEGLLLDPLVTARAFRVLIETLRRDPQTLGARVCFLHTGGPFGVFPLRDALTRLADASRPGA